jgi:hypothetical protein
VPAQAELHQLPGTVSSIMNGYQGDNYILVRDQLVIVDRESRRVVAIIPGIA